MSSPCSAMALLKMCMLISLCLLPCVLSLPSFTNTTLMGIVEDLYYRVLDYQVPETEHFFPPFHWDEEQGMWPSDVRLNFHGKPDEVIFRDLSAVLDNNMFATTYIMACLVEARRYVDRFWYIPTEEISKGLDAIKSHHDKNVDFDNSLMTFWPQKYNSTLNAYNSYPINLNDLIKLTDEMPLNATYKFLEKLGLKDVERILKEVMEIRGVYIGAFHIPPDFDDSFLNVGLGSILTEMKDVFPSYHQQWASHNTNLTSVFDALKKYAYRPFSGDQRVNTIDPRTYFYLRRWLEQEKTAGRDVALVSTWIQDTDEVREWFDKGVMMPFNVNNIDVTVCANFLFGVTSGIISGLFDTSLLDDPDILQIYDDTSRMIAFQIRTNFSDRADLALTYYPSVIEFYWFAARTYNILEQTLQRTGALPHKAMENVLKDLKQSLRTFASPAILAAGTKGREARKDVLFFDDFLGDADMDYKNNSVNNAEDRLFTTSMALNAFLTIWTIQDQHTHKLVWDKDTSDKVKNATYHIVEYLNNKILTDEFEPWNALFSGSYKGFTTAPALYPSNRIELFNGTRITFKQSLHAHGKYIEGVEGFIPEEEYVQMMKNITVTTHYHTPTVFHGYNQNAEFFPFWCSEAYTYVIAMLGLAKYVAVM